MKLTEREKRFLLEIARESIRSWISSTGFRYEPSLQPIISLDRPHVLEDGGAFVTLYKDGELRGCIGKLNPNYPLYLVVRDVAIEAATKDYRFSPLGFDEFNAVDIEISVLTPLKKISSIDEITLGQHGIYMVKDDKSGTFLPQVATETGWSKEDFLGHCSKDKMGMNWNDWEKSELFIYETIVFHERQFGLK